MRMEQSPTAPQSTFVQLLSEPLRLPMSGRVLPNRLLKAALTERLASWDPHDATKRGIPTAKLRTLYERWLDGHFGTVITGNIMVDHINLEAAGNMSISREDGFSGSRFEAFRDLTRQKSKAVLIGQLNHPGRQVKSIIQPDPVSAGDIPLGNNELKITANRPRAATKSDLVEIVASFAHAAEYLERAGFDGVQLHAAHGYLLGQFLSLTTNNRSDEYGGMKMQDRARLICEIAAAIRLRTSPTFILSIKINSVEFEDGGFKPEDARNLCEIIDENLFDFIELSGGTYISMGFVHKRESTRSRESFFLDFASQIVRPGRRTPVFVTGGLRSVQAMAEALHTVDGVGVGRPSTQEPDLAKMLLSHGQLTATKQACDQDNFLLTSAICGTQLRQIAEQRPILDASSTDQIEAFTQQLKAWMRRKAADTELRLYKPMLTDDALLEEIRLHRTVSQEN